MYTVLHIEESNFFCNIVKKTLINNGYSYISTNSFTDALSLIKDNNIDIILTSLYADGGTIENFIKDMNSEKNNDIPIFVVTSTELDESKKKLLNLGVTDYILKANIQKEIIGHIESVLKADQHMNKLKKAKIAIIDDNKFDSLIEKDLFRKYEIKNVDCYTSGKALLEKNKKYDIYLIDIVLKNEFGENVIRDVRKTNPKSLIIATTGLNNPNTLANILNCGANDYITKPINEQLFISKLKSNIK